MAQDDLVRLSRALRPLLLDGNGDAVAWHDDYEKKAGALPPVHREKLCELMSDIRAAMPSDFEFWVRFEVDYVDVSVELNDGNTQSSAAGGSFRSRKSMLRKIRNTDWDGCRASLMEQSSILDDLLRAADDRPPNIPSSQAAAEQCRDELSVYVQGVQKLTPIPQFTLIVGRDDAGLGVEHFKDRGEVVYTIADRMTTHCDILAVLERGVPWSFEEIEAAKLEAVEQLGPISRAKAEHRYYL